MRIHRLSRVVFVLVASAFVAGCSSDESPDSTSGAGASGSNGSAGIGGSSGSAGTAGTAGVGGASGTAGSAASGGSAGSAGSGGNAGVTPVDITWTACDLLLTYPASSPPSTTPGQCADVTLPLRYDAPDGPTLSVRAKRIMASSQPARAQLWLLNGGPGFSSMELEPVMSQIAAADPGLDVYTTDFRGVDKSTLLSCPQATNDLTPNEVSACLAKVEQNVGSIDGFTTTNGANDLAKLLVSTRSEGQKSYVFGFSYGTFWAHRFLQIFPELADGVVLDSIATPDSDFSTYDVDANSVAEAYFALCGQDATCASKLGADPWAKVQAFFALPPAQACPTAFQIDQPTWREIFTRALRKSDFRALAPALLYRALRCDADDQIAIQTLLTNLQSLPLEPANAFSLVLYDHIVLSELWATTPKTADEYDAIDAGLFIAPTGTGAQQRLWDVWARTPEDGYAGKTASTTRPLLLLQGGLDPQTNKSHVDPFAAAFTAPHQTYVPFPLSPHGVAFQTPTASNPTRVCGMDLLLQFVADPEAPLDLGCQADQPALDFSDQPELAQALLGQNSIWENNVPAPAPLTNPSTATRPRDAAMIREAFARTLRER